MLKDDFHYLREAYKFAATHSPDPSTQNGACLVDPRSGEIQIKAANRFPRGIEKTEERLVRPLKYKYIEHAERNIVYDAAATGIITFNQILYCPWYACTDCARAIIQARIAECVGHKFTLDLSPPRWMEEIELALDMLREAGVKCRFVEGKAFEDNSVSILFNEETVYP